MENVKKLSAKDVFRKIWGLTCIPLICLVASLILCAVFGTSLFIDRTSLATFICGTTYLTLLAFGVSINLHSGRFDFSISTTIIVSSTVVIMLACGGVSNMFVLFLAGLGTGILCGAFSGGLYLLLGLPPMICSLGVVLLFESIAFIIAGGVDKNNVLTSHPEIAAEMKSFIGENNGSFIWLLLILVAAVVFMTVVFDYTKFGYEYKALQSGQKIAVDTGAKEKSNAFLCYVIAGGLVGIAGFIFGCRIQFTRVSNYLNFATVSKMFDAFCPLFFSSLVMRYTNKSAAITISVVAYEFLQLAFGNINAVDTAFTSTIYGIINSVILVVFLIYLNNENKVKELVMLKGLAKKIREKKQSSTDAK